MTEGQSYKDLGKSIPGREKIECKDPGLGISLEFLRDIKMDEVTWAETVRRRIGGDEVGDGGGNWVVQDIVGRGQRTPALGINSVHCLSCK